MRKLLILALLLYDITSNASRLNSFDYDDTDSLKRHSFIDERRLWRKKALVKPLDLDRKEWDDRRRHEFDPRYLEEAEMKSFGPDRPRDLDDFARSRHYGDDNLTLGQLSNMKSAENGPSFIEKDIIEKKNSMNCDRPHERYESCFSGCASISCDNPRDRLRPCYPFCEAGCICVHPYVRDDRTHKCVLPEDCTKGLKGIPDIGEES